MSNKYIYIKTWKISEILFNLVDISIDLNI